MANQSRLVFDSSVLVSAAIFEGSTPGRALAMGMERRSILLSLATLHELTEVLERPKFGRYLTAEKKDRFVGALIRSSTFLEPSESIAACRDPKDNKFLEVAVAGQAAYIVSGNEDLLVLNPFRGIRIVTPAEFLEMTKREPGAQAAE